MATYVFLLNAKCLQSRFYPDCKILHFHWTLYQQSNSLYFNKNVVMGLMCNICIAIIIQRLGDCNITELYLDIFHKCLNVVATFILFFLFLCLVKLLMVAITFRDVWTGVKQVTTVSKKFMSRIMQSETNFCMNVLSNFVDIRNQMYKV